MHKHTSIEHKRRHVGVRNRWHSELVRADFPNIIKIDCLRTINVGMKQPQQPVPLEKKVAATLGKLNADSATLPDLLPARIFRGCCDKLAKPFR